MPGLAGISLTASRYVKDCAHDEANEKEAQHIVKAQGNIKQEISVESDAKAVMDFANAWRPIAKKSQSFISTISPRFRARFATCDVITNGHAGAVSALRSACLHGFWRQLLHACAWASDLELDSPNMRLANGSRTVAVSTTNLRKFEVLKFTNSSLFQDIVFDTELNATIANSFSARSDLAQTFGKLLPKLFGEVSDKSLEDLSPFAEKLATLQKYIPLTLEHETDEEAKQTYLRARAVWWNDQEVPPEVQARLDFFGQATAKLYQAAFSPIFAFYEEMLAAVLLRGAAVHECGPALAQQQTKLTAELMAQHQTALSHMDTFLSVPCVRIIYGVTQMEGQEVPRNLISGAPGVQRTALRVYREPTINYKIWNFVDFLRGTHNHL